MITETLIRKLAKKTENQNLFVITKDISSLRLFKNTRDLSYIQNLYLSFLFMYHNLNTDVECKRVSKLVLNNDNYADAYLLFRKEKGYEIDTKKKNKKTNGKREVHLVFAKKNSSEEK